MDGEHKYEKFSGIKDITIETKNHSETQIVDMFGNIINIEDIEGKDTAFWIRIPKDDSCIAVRCTVFAKKLYLKNAILCAPENHAESQNQLWVDVGEETKEFTKTIANYTMRIQKTGEDNKPLENVDFKIKWNSFKYDIDNYTYPHSEEYSTTTDVNGCGEIKIQYTSPYTRYI